MRPKTSGRKGRLTIQELDGRLLDGFTFCRRAYALLDRIRSSPGGAKELQLRTSQRSKKLMEEILPLAAYVQSRYGPALRLKIKWSSGNQHYDARQFSSGDDVERGASPREQYLEVTMAVHEKEYLAREHLSMEGFAFAPEGTRRDPKTKTITSTPIVHKYPEAQDELIKLIRNRITEKASKDYPKDTSLIVYCVANMVITDDDWRYVLQELRDKPIDQPFREIVLYLPLGPRVVSLYGR